MVKWDSNFSEITTICFVQFCFLFCFFVLFCFCIMWIENLKYMVIPGAGEFCITTANLSEAYLLLLHIMCGYQCDKAVNKKDTREVI